MVHMKRQYLFSFKNKKKKKKNQNVVCCSCDWRFKGRCDISSGHHLLRLKLGRWTRQLGRFFFERIYMASFWNYQIYTEERHATLKRIKALACWVKFSADNIMIFFILFPQNRLSHFMQVVS